MLTASVEGVAVDADEEASGHCSVSLESVREKDSSQIWRIYDDGHVTSAKYPHLTLMSIGKRAKSERRHGIGIKPVVAEANAVTDAKNKQDQTFVFQILLSSDEVR